MTERNAQRAEVIPATKEQESILNDLLQFYAQDFREFHDIPLDENGRFHHKQLPLYWSISTRHPFLVKVDGVVAGFVFVKKGSEISGNKDVWDMAEFFVMSEFRGRGIGTQVAYEIWRRFPGMWEVRVMEANVLAIAFWRKTITKFSGGESRSAQFKKDGEQWQLFSFQSAK